MSASRLALTHDDVTALVGPLEDGSVAAILALEPTQEELVEAWAWAISDPEPLVAAGKSLDGKVAALYEILGAEDEAEEE